MIFKVDGVVSRRMMKLCLKESMIMEYFLVN